MHPAEPTRLLRHVETHPNDVLALQSLASWYTRRGRVAEARDALRRALDADPVEVFTNLYIGNLAYEEQDWDTALAWFEFAAMIAPDIPPPLWCQADVYEFQGHQDLAERYFLKAVEMDPSDEQSARLYTEWRQRCLWRQARRHQADGRVELAEELLREMKELAPDGKETRRLLEAWRHRPAAPDVQPSDENSGA